MKVYIDDQRKAPEDWVQLFNSYDAIEFIVEHHSEITHIDFDYYLSETDHYDTGLKVIEYLISLQRTYDVNIFHSPQENYTFHSSDSFMNERMADAISYLFGRKTEYKHAKPKISQLQKLRNSKGRR